MLVLSENSVRFSHSQRHAPASWKSFANGIMTCFEIEPYIGKTWQLGNMGLQIIKVAKDDE
jgi:hypothetical protein